MVSGRAGAGIQSISALQTQLAGEIALAEGHTLPAEDVVSRRRMEVEIGLREGQEKFLRGEVEPAAAEFEAHVAPDEGLDLRRVDRLESQERRSDPFFQCLEGVGWRRPVRRKHASANA